MPLIAALVDTTNRLRRPEQTTDAGTVPAESTEDALARAGSWDDLNGLIRGAQAASIDRQRLRRQVLFQRWLGAALLVDAIAVPALTWGEMFRIETGDDFDLIVRALAVLLALVTILLASATILTKYLVERGLEAPIVDLEAP